MAQNQHPFELSIDGFAADHFRVHQLTGEERMSEAWRFDIVVTAAGRAFFTKLLDGLGVQGDAPLAEMDAALKEALTVGRPLDGAAPERLDSAA